MVAKAASGGKITSANKVQTSHVFSQFQLRVNFMGKVKLAFITPANSKIRKPTPAWSMFSPVLSSNLPSVETGLAPSHFAAGDAASRVSTGNHRPPKPNFFKPVACNSNCSPRPSVTMIEAMNESQVTIDGHSHFLPRPFMVIDR